jgi:predicted ArsR family transcriptional regulator
MQNFLCIIVRIYYNSGMQKDSTRQKIIELLRILHSATALEIARGLNLSGAAVRYHLTHLKQAGRIEVMADSKSREAGRPAKKYCLTTLERPNFLGGLVCVLLSERLAVSEPGQEGQVWKKLAHQIAGPAQRPQPLPKRLAQTIQHLNEMNYQARWEAGAFGPRILFSNCPYAAIWTQFPGLCQMDQHLLERWTGLIFRRVAHGEVPGSVPQTCIFEPINGREEHTLQLA